MTADQRTSACTQGWDALREDWRAYVEMHGATSALERALLPWRAPSLLAVALYRWGRTVVQGPSSWKTRLQRLAFGVSQQVVMRATKVSLPVGADIGAGVWMASHTPLFIAPGSKLGKRVRLYGGNTIGIGGRPGARGVPTLGDAVSLAPGAAVVGPVTVEAGTAVGPSAVVIKSFAGARVLAGAPARPSEESPSWLPAFVLPFAKTSTLHDPHTPEGFWQSFREDLQRYLVYQPNAGTLRKLKLALETDGLWALAVYRWGRALKTSRRPGWARFGWPVYTAGALGVRAVTGIHLDVDARIGPGFYIGHFGSIFVGPGVRIGRHSSISQMCCVAAVNAPGGAAAPELGERVYLGAGCKVLGEVTVGDGAAIGANAVVTSDIPVNGVAAGIPAAVVSLKGSGDFIFLGGRPSDAATHEPTRVAAQVAAAANVVSAAQALNVDQVANPPSAPAARNVVSPAEIVRAATDPGALLGPSQASQVAAPSQDGPSAGALSPDLAGAAAASRELGTGGAEEASGAPS